MIRLIPLAPLALLALSACAHRPTPAEVGIAMAPIAYEVAAKAVLARHAARPFTEAEKAAAKALDQRAFDAMDRGLAGQYERVRSLHFALQGL